MRLIAIVYVTKVWVWGKTLQIMYKYIPKIHPRSFIQNRQVQHPTWVKYFIYKENNLQSVAFKAMNIASQAPFSQKLVAATQSLTWK